jgi:integrase
MGVLFRNPAEFVIPPRPSRVKMAILSPNEIARFLEVASETSYYTFFSTLLCTGMRRGELLALRWRNLNIEHAVIYVIETAFKLGNGEYVIKEPKTPHSRRAVSLPASLLTLLRQYRLDRENFYHQIGAHLTEDDFVFSQADGKPLNPNAVTLAFRRIIKKAKLNHVRVHDLRHTHATLMLKAGVHPKIVSERLGHANIGITLDTYSHVLPGLQEAAMEKFDRIFIEEGASKNLEGNVSTTLARTEDLDSRPCRSRTCDTLIKSQVLCQLS